MGFLSVMEVRRSPQVRQEPCASGCPGTGRVEVAAERWPEAASPQRARHEWHRGGRLGKHPQAPGVITTMALASGPLRIPDATKVTLAWAGTVGAGEMKSERKMKNTGSICEGHVPR
ncbi:hypothetical protein [Rhodovastum atsumiense]|uniref:Uncharacterized protein n=1 Tax=Rhodovastum atsumiense TaxID=504468 RepID=A0A5M6IN79_9PROT|nr:hypothetical protein [Rhodovastum atsumiense]KAA5609339.1 hypothetical protein F1189_24750 [Rhodovastum atsumiense]